ncbi:hypothetical protein SBA4_3530004 [Candidatus Sulfopaludibacter sp. SbA4]|nr:hypothetical protein SBA4_3530004 [Candidatus Sulfopaludibacter sp. SbA4]
MAGAGGLKQRCRFAGLSRISPIASGASTESLYKNRSRLRKSQHINSFQPSMPASDRASVPATFARSPILQIYFHSPPTPLTA